MISQSCHITAQISKHPQFGGLSVIYSLYQSSHGEVSAIQYECICILFLVLIDQCFQPGKPAGLLLCPVYNRLKAVQMRMQIMGEQDIQMFWLL